MKDILLILTIVLVNINCSSNKVEPIAGSSITYNCDSCDLKNDAHKYYLDSATILIKDFADKFNNLASYGGTIYGDTGYFKRMSDAENDNSLVLKFHFCLKNGDPSTNTKDNLFLVFQNENCTSVKHFAGKPFPALFKCSSDASFPALKFDPTIADTIVVKNHKVIPQGSLPERQKRQNILLADVIKAKDDFKTTNNPYKKYLGCTDYSGYFIIDRSVAIILDSKNKCEGIRYYFGLDSKRGNKIRVILVGVDKDGSNQIVWSETSIPYYLE